ncbi:hypothetical protein G7Y89_g10834 [Cudoniella acicularis]|uniref:Uncharacterized protein n=1 Tax=Cudoniella acicularis TaxID=354080 RepID=A0A8H4RD29_9HELO|nr:hypothetical protein G7Y89_g10834 [Cudoniella acicularis]
MTTHLTALNLFMVLFQCLLISDNWDPIQHPKFLDFSAVLSMNCKYGRLYALQMWKSDTILNSRSIQHQIEGHPVRRVLASTTVEGYIRRRTPKFAREIAAGEQESRIWPEQYTPQPKPPVGEEQEHRA